MSNYDIYEEGFRSIRHGGMRGRSISGGRTRTARYEKSDDLPAPNIVSIGNRPFAQQELDLLTGWLHAPGWPRGSMNIYALQGYLVALLVLPLGLRSAVWMPSIWNASGWKIPLQLERRAKYDEFLELLIGFMRSIDDGLSASPPQFEFVKPSQNLHRTREAVPCLQDWVLGFGRALSHCTYLDFRLEPTARKALHAIANAAASRRNEKSNALATLQHAVSILALCRTSRGPLAG